MHRRAADDATDSNIPLVFIHFQDAAGLWKRLIGEGVTDIGPVQDMDYGCGNS